MFYKGQSVLVVFNCIFYHLGDFRKVLQLMVFFWIYVLLISYWDEFFVCSFCCVDFFPAFFGKTGLKLIFRPFLFLQKYMRPHKTSKPYTELTANSLFIYVEYVATLSSQAGKLKPSRPRKSASNMSARRTDYYSSESVNKIKGH